MGAEQYGQFEFLKRDTLQMACEEVLDLANYALMSYIKVRLIMISLEREAVENVDVSDIGPKAFIPINPRTAKED